MTQDEQAKQDQLEWRLRYERPEEPEDDEAERDVQFYVVQRNPGTVRGVWRDKKMRADRHPLYFNPHDERALWLSPGVRRRRRTKSQVIQEIMEIEKRA